MTDQPVIAAGEERTPDFEKLLGKKVLATPVLLSCGIKPGALVLIVEGIQHSTTWDDENQHWIDTHELQWQIATPESMMQQWYEEGIHKVVGAGLVTQRLENGKWQVMVNDHVQTEFGDDIPF